MNTRITALLPALALLLLITPLATPGCGTSEPAANQSNQGQEVNISITSPTADSIQTESRVRVTGTATGTTQVMVNGQPAAVSGGQWERMVNFDDGPATVIAEHQGVQDSVSFYVDTRKPDLAILTPARGTVIDAADGPTLTIRGEASDDGSGLLAVLVNGNVIDDDDGAFAVDVELETGLNVFKIVARDRANNERIQYRGVIYGPLADPTTSIDDALTMDVSPAGLHDLSDVIEAYATPEQILAILGDGAEGVTVNDMTFDNLDVTLTPRDGYIEASLTLEGLMIDGALDIGAEEPIEAIISIATVTVSMDLALAVGEDNALEVTVLESSVDIDPDDIQTDLTDLSLVQVLIAGAIIYVFDEFVVALIQENLYDPDILTREFEFLDRTIEIQFQLQEILITIDGVRVGLGLAFPAAAYPDVNPVPGALHRPVGADAGSGMARPFRLHTHRTALDRILHSVWRAGLFHQTIGGDDIDGFALPFDLTADSLATLLDQRIRDIHDPETPVELRLRPLLPPIVEFEGTTGDDELKLALGEFLIDFYLRPAPGERTHFLSVALYMDIDVEPVFDEFEISFDLSLTAEGDIAEEPLFTFERERTVDLILSLINLVPFLIGNELTIDGQANFEWASLSDFAVEVNGPARDRVTAGFRLSPAADFIDGDEVD